MDGMVWEKDGMVDATELWALSSYEGLPRVPPVWPIMSLDNPHTICFIVCEWFHVKNGGDKTTWGILVDTWRKTLLSVSRYSTNGSLIGIFPSRISCYFDFRARICDGASSSREGHKDMIPSSPVFVIDEVQRDNAGNSVRSSCKSSSEPAIQDSAIMAAFREIPRYGLDHDDMLKAYIILSEDNGRMLRSLLGLPKNLRKDWLLVEIKSTKD
ncbi:unnamed protein product [Urochloa humidicola]